MKKLTILLLISSLIFSSCSENKDIIQFEAMNTFMTVQSYGRNSAAANQEVRRRIDILEDYISTTKEHSDLYKLNVSQETEIEVHKETFDLLDFAKTMAVKTNGALNPCLYNITSAWGFTTGDYKVPSDDELKFLLRRTDYNHLELNPQRNTVLCESGMKLDLGAVGKGFAGDQAIRVLKEKGIKSALLDLGGNIQALGKKPDGSDWRVGIKSPWDGTAIAGVRISDRAVITSGGYERFFKADDGKSYIHIFDGSTGYPVENEIACVTIVCDSGLYGDALSTALFVMGVEKACEYWKANSDFEMIIITNDHGIYYTSGLADKIALIGTFNHTEIIEQPF